MKVDGSFNAYDSYRFGFGFISTIERQRSVTISQNRRTGSDQYGQSVYIKQQLERMRKAVEGIRPLMLEAKQIEVVRPARAISAFDLGLDLTETSTSTQSTEEVNSTPTSFSPFGPEWTGGSTAQATIGGVYDGSNGTDTLTFKVTKQGTHGEDNLQLRVFDSNNEELDKIDIKKSDSIDRQYTLSNGLVLTLGEGDLSKKDTFSVEVFDSVGSSVDPDKPFNGLRNNNPNLESGFSISDGSFEINGVTIDVSASDTVTGVLDRITQSNAGVTAMFDAATEKVLLTHKTPGSAPDIILGNDTSGFLAAMKLDEATAIPGIDPETKKPLAEVERFSSVQSGTISVNGVSITIDVNADSLTDVLDRITASDAEVTASFSSISQRVSLISDVPDSQLVLASGATDFFGALGISDGPYSSVGEISTELFPTYSIDRLDQDSGSQAVSDADARMLGTLVQVISKSMNALFDDTAFMSSPSAMLEQVRDNIRSAVSTTFDSEGPAFKTDFGINFDFDKTTRGVFDFSQADQRRLGAALTTPEGRASVHDMLFGSQSDGLLERLHAVLSKVESGLETEAGSTGLFVNAWI